MKNGYSFRKCNIGDCAELAGLINRTFATAVGCDYLEWKHLKSPCGPGLSSVAICSERVVGLLGAVPVRFVVNDIETVGVQEVDVVIEENHRNLNVYLGIVNQEKKNLMENRVNFTYGVTVEDTSRLSQTLFGKKRIGPVPRLVKILKSDSFIKEKLSMGIMEKPVLSAINAALCFLYPGVCKVPRGKCLRTTDRFDQRFDRLWQEVKKDYPIMVKRDAAYLNWRYTANPVARYEVHYLCREESDEIDGYIVTGIKAGKNKRGIIYDILTPAASDPKTTRCLINHAVGRLRTAECPVVECWMFPHTHVYPELVRAGFIKREKKGYTLSFQGINPDRQDLCGDFVEHIPNWYFTRGDSDNL